MAIDVSIVSCGHDIGDARLHRLAGALTHHGLAVEVMATGSRDFAPVGVTHVVTASRGGMKRRIIRALVWPWRAHGRLIIVIDPDAVPSAWVRRRRGKIVVADVHEDYVQLLRDRAWASGVVGVLARLLMRLITRMTATVDMTLVADEHVPPTQAKNRFVLRNTPYARHLPGPSQPDDVPRALHVGDLRRSRGLFEMLDVIEALPKWRLDLVGPVAAADEAEFQRRIQQPSLQGRVRWYGRRPPQQAWAFATGAWVGLSLLTDTPAFREAIPSKLYEFISCGLPVVGSALPRQAELIERTGAGVVVASTSEAVGALQRYEHDHELLKRHRDAAVRSSFVDDTKYEDFAALIATMSRK